MTRSAQLDSIRGIAVLLVLLHHWTSVGSGLVDGLGNIGVQLFFVVSGFLITRILLRVADDFKAGRTTLKASLVSFHFSRIARIWPVAFLTIALVFAAGERFSPRGDAAWHALFASNVLFFLRGEFTSSLAHFWTLAVEQQFYLVWPFVVLRVRRERLEAIIVGLVLLAPLFRLALYAGGYSNFAQFNVLPFANFDSLGMGALLALWLTLDAARAAGRWRLLARLAVAACLAIAALQVVAGLGFAVPANPAQTLYAVAFAWLVAAANRGIGGDVGAVLRAPVLAGLGTISYGVYVYHMYSPRAVGAGLRWLGAPEVLHAGLPLFVASLLLTLAVAMASWRWLEQPVLKWRKLH